MRITAIRLTLAATFVLVSAVPAAAQQWRWEEVDSVGIRFLAPSRLERLPLKLGTEAAYLRARLRPKDIGDYVRARYPWSCDVYQFVETMGKGQEGDDARLKGIPEELREKLRGLLARAKTHGTFASWLDAEVQREGSQGGGEIVTKDRTFRGRSGGLDYKRWEWMTKAWTDVDMYNTAAVYSFGDRQVALVVRMPIFNGKRPRGRYRSLVERIILSGKKLDVDDSVGVDSARDKHADTAARKEALEAAKRNIKNLKGWDYFTTPSYIVLYSWDFEKSEGQRKHLRESQNYAEMLERMRGLYEDFFPLDESGTRAMQPQDLTLPGVGPITGDRSEKKKGESEPTPIVTDELLAKERIPPYPVFRLCATYEQFNKYGGTGGGVVGWFNPMSKELVVFLGGDKMMGKGATETVIYHEGWHQFSDVYFAGARQHRWFDEGHGDFFGSYRWIRGKWQYVGSKMRHESVQQMVRKGDYVPFKSIVRWNKRRFYSGKAPYYYAQAYSMIDFFRRGHRQRRGWDERYAKVLPIYGKALLLTRDQEQAVKSGFHGFEDADWKALEDAWKAWVASSHFKGG